MPRARYKTLVDTLAADIRGGRLLPGTRLPTHRELAAREGLALVTASRVYAELETMGLVSGETGRGTFVREALLPPGQGIDQPTVPAGAMDLNFNYPTLPGQADMLRNGLRQLAGSGDLEALLRYQPHGGRPHERAVVAGHLQSLGLPVSGEQVLIVSGAQHGLAITVMGLLQPGDVVAVDALTYSGFKALAQTHRLELASIPASGLGMDLQALEKLCKQRRVRAIYTMPTLHNPLGWVMSAVERERLAAIARRYDLLIIEDAAYAFLVENPPPPLATFAPERTVYVSGLSKSVATGLRVGFVAAPLAWVHTMERAIRATTWNTPGVMTAMACNWLNDGTVGRCEVEKRLDAQVRFSVAERVLRGMPMIGHPASYFLWLPLAEELRADQVAVALLRENVSVSTAEPFATSVNVPHAIRLALGSVALEVLPVALDKVRRVIGVYD
ncbi:PLP-dependent aminotransferase family protein [Pseudomonas abieticivorans]|uniref:aminotransferase-like domain-containing protein n=1 Tax=Pseudomonas abieticivorans TaxID=2931382 RepID=UPI0020C124FD|nr:PLP-dependent aminotransferase family protein [Pseudomonas sp. PIA16]